MSENKKTDFQHEGVLWAVGAICAAAIAIKFMVPIVLGFAFAILGILATVQQKQLAQKSKSLLLLGLNLVTLIYLSFGLPFATGNKNQWTGIFGDVGINFIWGKINEWNRFVSTSDSFFKKLATVKNLTWVEASAMVWGGVMIGTALIIAYEFFLYFNNAKKQSSFTDTLKASTNSPSKMFNGLSFPVYPLLRFFSFKPAHKGHSSALLARSNDFSFLTEIAVDAILYFLLVIPLLFIPNNFNDFYHF